MAQLSARRLAAVSARRLRVFQFLNNHLLLFPQRGTRSRSLSCSSRDSWTPTFYPTSRTPTPDGCQAPPHSRRLQQPIYPPHAAHRTPNDRLSRPLPGFSGAALSDFAPAPTRLHRRTPSVVPVPLPVILVSPRSQETVTVTVGVAVAVEHPAPPSPGTVSHQDSAHLIVKALRTSLTTRTRPFSPNFPRPGASCQEGGRYQTNHGTLLQNEGYPTTPTHPFTPIKDSRYITTGMGCAP